MNFKRNKQIEIIQELKKRINECEIRKEYLINYVKLIQERYLDKKIDADKYRQIINEKVEGKSIPERIGEYEYYIKRYKYEIFLREKTLNKTPLSILIPLTIIIMLLFALLILRPMFLGK